MIDISTNILAERLKRLETHGIVRREANQGKPVRYAYQLTEKGADLEPLLRAMVRWGWPMLRAWEPGDQARTEFTARLVRHPPPSYAR